MSGENSHRGMVPIDAFLSRRDRDPRLARLTHDIVLPIARGLEFGPLNAPTCLPEGLSVEYVDHAFDAAADLPDAVGIDHIWTGAGAPPFKKAVYDFAIASQVAQYVPNLLGWCRGIFQSLRPGGVFNLSLPDRRYIFDVRRKPSTLGEALEAYHLDYARPSLRQVFDHIHGASAVGGDRLWNETVDLDTVPRVRGDDAPELAYRELMESPKRYTLTHCWVFTPLSFLDMIEGASRLGLFSFVISQFAATEPMEFEFFVCLRRDAEDDDTALLRKQLAAVDHVRRSVLRRQQIARALGRE